MNKISKKYILLLLITSSINIQADWKDTAKTWTKIDADKLLEEKREKYSPPSIIKIPSGANDAIDKINDALDLADGLGLGGGIGDAINQAQGAMSMVNNQNFTNLIMDTGLNLLGAADSAMLGICYDKVGDGKWPSIPDWPEMPKFDLDPCAKFKVGFDGVDACGALPELPGYRKKTTRILEMDTRNVELMCGNWKEGEGIVKTTIAQKVFSNDASKSVTNSVKMSKNTNVTQKIKRTQLANVTSVSKHRFERAKTNENGEVLKDSYGKPIKEIIRPMRGLDKQDTPDKKLAYDYIKNTLEKKAAEGGSFEDIEELRKDLVGNSYKLNVAYKNEHEYVLARSEAVEALYFKEREVFDTSNDILLFRTQVIKFENDVKDSSARATAIKNVKEQFVLQYKKRIEDWLEIKEIYYFKYDKKGINAPTKYYIDSVTNHLEKEEKSIKRAALVQQVDNEMNKDAQEISKIRIEGQKLVNNFERKLEIEIIANRKFDIENALANVGLSTK